MLYREMINPDLYDNSFVAGFMDTLLEPEVDSASDSKLNTIKMDMMATDDIEMLCDPLSEEAQEKIISTGTLAPQFATFPARNQKICFELETEIPTKSKNIRNFLHAGKALGLISLSQCTFFSTMQPLKDGFPAVGEEVTDLCPWGVIVIGSSLRGNCFVQLKQITRNSKNMCFDTLHQKILREGKYQDYPFSRFFHIHDANEMDAVVSQIPKLMMRGNMSEQECIINFAATLKALKYFGYHH
ncbi:MAG: hypothetical protein ACXAC5_01320 [Promethearchaeota archaeon]|jgi:hypothetical protein